MASLPGVIVSTVGSLYLLTIQDVTPLVAVGISLLALICTALSSAAAKRSSRASQESASTARRALELNSGITPYLTDAQGGLPQIEVSEIEFKLWVTYYGATSMRISGPSLTYRGPRPKWPRSHRARAIERGAGAVSKPLLEGGGPDGGANVAEVTIPLEGNHAVWTVGHDAIKPHEALRTGGRTSGELGIEFDFLAIRLGTTQHKVAVVEGTDMGWWPRPMMRDGTLFTPPSDDLDRWPHPPAP